MFRVGADGAPPRGARDDAAAAGMDPRTRVRARMRPHERTRVCVPLQAASAGVSSSGALWTMRCHMKMSQCTISSSRVHVAMAVFLGGFSYGQRLESSSVEIVQYCSTVPVTCQYRCDHEIGSGELYLS